jgi:hypothetical protein
MVLGDKWQLCCVLQYSSFQKNKPFGTTLSQPLHIEIGLFVDTCAPDSGATQFRFSCPSTQLAIRVPHLGLHFSPARYSRFMLILHALEGVNQLRRDWMLKRIKQCQYNGSMGLLWGGSDFTWGVMSVLLKRSLC